MVNRSEADIAVTDIFATLSRSKVVDFSNIIDYVELVWYLYKSSIWLDHFRNRFFIRDPGRYLGGVFAFTKGFRDDAWLATVILILSLPAALHMIYFILRYSKMIEEKDWNYFWNIFVYFGTFTQQVSAPQISTRK